jgi:hypothetical protein
MSGQGDRPALNPRCETVHTHLRTPPAAVRKLRLKIGRQGLAEQLKAKGANSFGSAAAALDAAAR